jgi:hypothetical protein
MRRNLRMRGMDLDQVRASAAIHLFRSRLGDGPTDSCTPCGQVCGQVGALLGQPGPRAIGPQSASGVPTRVPVLYTAPTRTLACVNHGQSPPSTVLTAVTAVISSGTLLVSSVGDELLDPANSRPDPLTITACRRRRTSSWSPRSSPALLAGHTDPEYHPAPVWSYGGTPRDLRGGAGGSGRT